MFPYWFTLMLILYMRLFLESHAVSHVCSQCECEHHGLDCSSLGLTSVPYGIPKYAKYLDFSWNQINKIEKGTFENLTDLETLQLSQNKLTSAFFHHLPSLTTLQLNQNKLTSAFFHHLPSLTTLQINHNELTSAMFHNLPSLKYLELTGNKLTSITPAMFHHLPSLTTLNLQHNKIKNYVDGAFLFLSNLTKIDLSYNNNLMCGCHLPAVVNYMKKVFNRRVAVFGRCRVDLANNQSKVIRLLKYSQCKNYSLFQGNLQCQTCSGMMCNDSEVKSCPNTEPVCKYTVTMEGVSLKFERSCSTYKTCLEAERKNTFRLNEWANGTPCVACCTGDLCIKRGFIGCTNSFVFYLIQTTKTPYDDDASWNFNGSQISKAMEREFLNRIGAFKVKYCGSEENTNIFTISCLVQSHISKDQLRENITNIIITSQTLRNVGIRSHYMEVTGDMFCKEDTTNNDILYWPRTTVGTTAKIPCHANVATRHCSSRKVLHQEMPASQYMTSPTCSPFTGIWQEPDMSQCNNTKEITRQLKDINCKEINSKNFEDLSKKLLDLSKQSMYFNGEDIVLAVSILENIAQWKERHLYGFFGFKNSLYAIINNLINTPEKSLVEAEQFSGIVNRMLDFMEVIPNTFLYEMRQISFLDSNIGIGTSRVEEDTFDGIVYGISYGNHETDAKSVIYDYSYPDLELEDIEMMDYISLPKSILKHLKDEERSTISSISFSSMQDEKLYKVIQESNGQEYQKLNSHIIAAHIHNIPITDLDEPVNISLNLIHQNATNPQCVYWDKSAVENPHWSTKGCSIQEYVAGEKALCFCNHLTSFALLMDVYQNEESIKNSQPLSLISYIGCGMSFVFLILTLIIHVCFKNLWKLMASKILVNLCSSLAITNIIFVVGMQEYAVGRIAVCKTVAALLHYFLMTSLMWMTVEARHVYLALFVVFKTYQKYFMLRSSILAWGVPAVIVIITLVINYTNNYIRRGQVCWLSEASFYTFFLSPVVVILIFNLTIFCLAIWRLMSMQNNKTFQHKKRKVRVFGIVGLFFLLGLTWVLAFFAFGAAAEAFKYLFAIFNTLQGTFIFIFYCIYKKDTRDVLSQRICKGKKVNLRNVTKNKISSSSGIEVKDKRAETKL